ncbi:dTDP-glucose 4,6-dehydratase [bacterium BMS3Bbin06]|nr:dTDP-glucose 4,6-dehydratase [bacterium BMS3Abin08]GBE34986.1 dTDP-glucose 4,6-dehydratase [bacterium BMS3Bbin06]HDO35250.1 dTDP-glucose 4,6-dehydratase [Nitrospirota bacterium]
MRILVTGGYGFIGSNFVRFMLRHYDDCEIVNLDALTYAGNRENLRDIEPDGRYTFVHGRIEDARVVAEALRGCDAIINFAAESHVDRSIEDAHPFLKTNVTGLQVLIDSARTGGVKRFVHLSTDEVYGSLEDDTGSFAEESPLMPNSPYSASKAAGDLLIRSYIRTFNLPAIIVRPTNNYGPYQYPEKFIPLMITNLLDERAVPVYGEGLNIRDWLYVEDTCSALDRILREGQPGEVYNVGGGNEIRNLDVVRAVISKMGLSEDSIEFVSDRPGHDYRYSVDSDRIRSRLGWQPRTDFESGLGEVIGWYSRNEWWWRPLKEKLKNESRGFWTVAE